MKGEIIMTNEQLAHDLTITCLAEKQLSASDLVAEYQAQYESIFNILKSKDRSDPPLAQTEAIPRPF